MNDKFEHLKRMEQGTYNNLTGHYNDTVEVGKEYIFLGDPTSGWSSAYIQVGTRIVCDMKDTTDGIHHYRKWDSHSMILGAYLHTTWLHDPSASPFVVTVDKTTGQLIREFSK